MRYAKLMMVTDSNNNKFYDMEELSNGTIKVTYGRVGTTGVEETSNKSWYILYNSKIKKGYKDVTENYTVNTIVKENKYLDEKEIEVKELITKLRLYLNKELNDVYLEVKKVTEKQVKNAQRIIDELKVLKNTTAINNALLELYSVIPRKMKLVNNCLLPYIKLEDILEEEQNNIYNLISYINNTPEESTIVGDENLQKELSYTESIGVNLKLLTNIPDELKYITDQLKYRNIFEVNKEIESNSFKDILETKNNKTTRILIHGTKPFSVLPILEQGLKIRPSGNFTFSGKVYGNGTYFSEVSAKSLGYTGNQSDKYFLIYEVFTGNPFVYNGWYNGNEFTLDEDNLNKRGFDSTYVKAGNGLLNSEIIAYNEKHYRVKYLIHI